MPKEELFTKIIFRCLARVDLVGQDLMDSRLEIRSMWIWNWKLFSICNMVTEVGQMACTNAWDRRELWWALMKIMILSFLIHLETGLIDNVIRIIIILMLFVSFADGLSIQQF